MRRISVLVVAAMMAALMMVASATPALAVGEPAVGPLPTKQPCERAGDNEHVPFSGRPPTGPPYSVCLLGVESPF